jgi:hypothetical protein
MAWALNSGVYCFLGLLGVMSGFWCLLVQNSSAPHYADPTGYGASSVLNALQTGLSMLGFVPGFGAIADVVNAGISAARGDYIGAGFSLAAAVPFIGDFAAAGKAIRSVTQVSRVSHSAAPVMSAARVERAVAANTAGRTNAQLVQNVATRADNWGTRQGLGLGPRAGTLKHGYADELLTRYQNIYGNRGLQTETSWLGNAPATYGTRGSARLDVWEPATGTVFDYKFGNAVLSPSQVNKITTQGPLGVQQVIQVKP